MSKFLSLLLILFTGSVVTAQTQTLSGFIYNVETGLPVPDAYVTLLQEETTRQTTLSDARGYFSFVNVPNGIYTLKVSHVGYDDYSMVVSLNENFSKDPIRVNLSEKVNESQETVVEAFRATAKTPVTHTTLAQKDIEARYVGHDIPTLISSTPSVNSFSDAGNGMGYSYFRLRGIDQTRINMTVNGVPVNDPENQGFFTNNFADLASSAEQIQIQRGVGTTTNGVAAFGGSVNVVTKSLAATPSFILHTGYGSFNSRRNTVEYQTGRIGKRFAFYGRLSELASDGYREHSATQNQSYFISGGYFGNKSVLKINAWGGIAQSQLSFAPIDKTTLDNNRRFNPLTPEERDEFRQNFFQVQYTYNFSAKSNISASAYYVKGKAPYFDYRFYGMPYYYINLPPILYRNNDTITSTGFIGRYRLDQQLLGGYASYNYQSNGLTLNLGLSANQFMADHYMEVPWIEFKPDNVEPNHRAYFNTGTKQETSAFVKAGYDVSEGLSLFADVQVRRAVWRYKAAPANYNITAFVEDMDWLFINPKVGARYAINTATSVYLNAGMTSREPTRLDYLRDDLATRDIKQDELKPESVLDIEAGWNINSKNLFLNTNLYYMQFQNQIANTGLLNAFGAPITQNTGSGTRMGVEIDGVYRISPRWALTNSSSFSMNSIQSFTQYFVIYDEANDSTYSGPVTYTNTTPALTPAIIVNQGVRFTPFNYLILDVNGRYVSQQYIDNTESEGLSIPEYYVLDAALSLKLEQWTKTGEQSLSIRVNNITNTLYAPSGAIGGYSNTLTVTGDGNKKVTTPAAYFPAATTNFFVTLMIKF